MVLSASATLTYHMIIIIMIPIMIASMYVSKRFSVFAFHLTIFSIIVSTYVGYYFGVCDANMVLLTATSLKNLSQNGKFLLDTVNQNPFAQLLGMELLEVREGYAYGRMRMDEHFTNIYGGMHGGCAYALADTLAGLAASTYGNYVTTIEGKMNYLEAVKDTGYVYGEAEVQRQGGRIGVYTVKLMDENQKVLVTADFTYYRTGQAIDQQG